MIRVSDRWQRVAVSDLERQQFRLLRRELGIDQGPEDKKDKKKEVRRRRKSAA